MDKMPVGVKIAYYSVKEVEHAVLISSVLNVLAAVDKSKAAFTSNAFNFLYDFSNIAATILSQRKNK